ncbi:MAG TPA: hypothetical protein VIY86_03445, partial [Pirellulaceae bacterium]
SVPEDESVTLALSGEMGRSLFAFPASYLQMVDWIRQRPNGPHVAVGVALNHGGIAGDHVLNASQRHDLQELLERLQFLGFSDYRQVQVPPRIADFEEHVEYFLSEWKALGLEVPPAMPLHFSEVGIGGYAATGHTEDPAAAVKTPYAGGGSHRGSPWVTPEMRTLRLEYHTALLAFLKQQSAIHPVTAAFLWSTGSWDPQGIREPGAADSEITQRIRTHNASARR